ncbi:hypothetical protein [Streptomyces sp. NPDC058954]|uniref:hypothetical protein n=1 Tax=Streptomyces sp. NPDC058954 TaxID=3346677 RepID=UPI0036886751
MSVEPTSNGEGIFAVNFDKLSSGDGDVEIGVSRSLLRRFEYVLVPPILEALIKDADEKASGLPQYANRCQSRADFISACSNTLAALTGLTIWATVQTDPAWWAKVLVALAALSSAVLGFLPSIYHWSDKATKARQLASEYGHLYGELLKAKGKILKGEVVSDEGIEIMRAELEFLKKQRQEIDA